jgi:hypothetical protein
VAVWVSNFDQGSVVCIPLTSTGTLGHARRVATGLGTVDDFAFIGDSDTFLITTS